MDTIAISLLSRNESREYAVPAEPGISALWAVRYIYEHYDRRVVYPTCLCRIGKCGRCTMKLDGETVIGCAAMLTKSAHEIQLIDRSE